MYKDRCSCLYNACLSRGLSELYSCLSSLVTLIGGFKSAKVKSIELSKELRALYSSTIIVYNSTKNFWLLATEWFDPHIGGFRNFHRSFASLQTVIPCRKATGLNGIPMYAFDNPNICTASDESALILQYFTAVT